MTREEAIQVLKSMKEVDLISRADAIKCVRWGWSVDDVVNAIKELPSTNIIKFDFSKYQPRVRNKVNDGTPSAEADHDGCLECRYLYNTEHEYPCKSCKQNYLDMWEQKPNDFVAVVRCKTCRHYSVEGDTTHFGWCEYWSKPTDEMRFCSIGERREE